MDMKDCTIRSERKEDYRTVENLIRESFWNVYRPGCTEHFVLNQYRSNPDFIPELDFVMEEDGRIIGRTTSGGACLNDTIMHIANSNVPFGGVGNSGMGSYHSERSFLAFSHERSVIKTPTWIDLPFRYMPYKLFPLVKKML